MNRIVVFKQNEDVIISKTESILQKKNKTGDIDIISNNRVALNELARSISLYPSILDKQSLGNSSRNVETLVENLCFQRDNDFLLHTPTKALLGKGFSVAKINFFFMVLYISRESGELKDLEDDIYKIITDNIFMIMAEEVFIAIISDKDIPHHIRTNAGYLLAQVWEHRIDYGVKEFAPILTTIWNARKEMKPAYGTMMGLSELFSITKNTDSVLAEYIGRDEFQDDEFDSLREFLMGMSSEEVDQLSCLMDKQGKTTVDSEIVQELFGNEDGFPAYRYDDPREFYSSFRKRKKNAEYRSRAEINGPKKTIEEYLMSYLLSRPSQWFTL